MRDFFLASRRDERRGEGQFRSRRQPHTYPPLILVSTTYSSIYVGSSTLLWSRIKVGLTGQDRLDLCLKVLVSDMRVVAFTE